MSHRESAVRPGRSNHLVGVLTEPANAVPGSAPAVLLLSAGVVHSAGPFRMYVELARALADRGFTVLRFDLSGIGDSVQPRDARTVQERTVDDVTDAMDFLSRRLGFRSFVLGGLCSAADDAHTLTCVDDRVVGNIMLDGYAYPTLRYRIRRVTSRLSGPSLVPRACARALRLVSGGAGDETGLPAPQHVPRPFPEATGFRTEMRASLDRGVQYLCVFSGGVAYYNHAGQFRQCLGLPADEPALVEVYIDQAEHTYPIQAHRRRMIDIVGQWVTDRFGVRHEGPKAPVRTTPDSA